MAQIVNDPGGSGLVKSVLDIGMTFLGQPYKWGGSTPQTGFDCSGLVQYLYGANGIKLPRVSSQQARVGRGVSVDQAQPGDLVAFDNSSARPGIDHIGIYLGNGLMLQAPRTGRNIEVVRVDLGRAAAIRRVATGPQAFQGLQQSGGRFAYPAVAGQGATDPGSIDYRAGGSDPRVQPVDRDAAIASYGYVAELANGVPDIKRILDTALAQGWTSERFTAEVQKTAWWRATAATQRQMQVLKAQDPAEYAKQLRQKRAEVTQLAYRFGASEDSKRLDFLSEQALLNGWSSADLQRYVAADVKIVHGVAKGQAAVTLADLKERASQYLIAPNEAELTKWTRDILAGSTDGAAFSEYVKKQAKALFPSLSGAIDRGVTVAQYVEPYRQLAAQTLELSPEVIDFTQSKYRDPLFQVDPKTGERGTMSLSDYATYLRKQPEYRKTAGAREAGAQLGESLLQQFGKVA